MNATVRGEAARLGMWVFLASELMFFGPWFLGYAYGRLRFPEAFAAASRETEVILGTANTAILLTSSFTMALAVEAGRIGRSRFARAMLAATAALGLAFLAVKGAEYRLEWGRHLFPGAGFSFPAARSSASAGAAELFYFLYFGMTAVHALHLTVAIGMVLVFALGWRRVAARGGGAERLEVAGLYWHFVDGVWIVLYPILYLVGRSG